MTTRALIIGTPERELIAAAISSARVTRPSSQQIEARAVGIPVLNLKARRREFITLGAAAWPVGDMLAEGIGIERYKLTVKGVEPQSALM